MLIEDYDCVVRVSPVVERYHVEGGELVVDFGLFGCGTGITHQLSVNVEE